MVTYTKANLKIKKKEREYCIIRMVIGMKGNGKMMIEKEREYCIIRMAIGMMGNGKTIKEKERGYYIIIKMIIVIEKKGYGNMIK